MKLFLCNDALNSEHRVFLTPQDTERLSQNGIEVYSLINIGKMAGFLDAEYTTVHFINNSLTNIKYDIILTFTYRDTVPFLHMLSSDGIIICYMNDLQLTPKDISPSSNILCLEKIPRTTVMQPMDTLSSQATLAGYRAACIAMYLCYKCVYMLFTAAGVIYPAQALIIGAGVAGLQAAIALKRMGVVVKVFDVREAVEEQIKSIGCDYITINNQSTDPVARIEKSDGYARQMSSVELANQQHFLAPYVTSSHIIITTAQLPQQPAPVLITKETVQKMIAGSVIVDLAIMSGGNCEMSVINQTITTENNIHIVGNAKILNDIARDASCCLSANIYNLLMALIKDKKIDKESVLYSNMLYNVVH